MQGKSNETMDAALAAIRHLPAAVRQKMQALYEDGTIRPGDIDSRCILNLQALQEPLQLKVFQHIERDRVFFTNARSKAGFLVGACEKAKRGELDVRGYGSIDPWAKQMAAVCVPVKRLINLVPEHKWLSQHHSRPITLTITSDTHQPITITCTLQDTISAIKDKLQSIHCPIKRNQMKLIHPKLSVLKDTRSLAYYNLTDTTLDLRKKFRGGRKINKPE